MSAGQGSGRLSIVQACAYDDKLMTPALRDVLGLLGTYSDEDGYCYPKQQTLADRLGIVRENVNRHIKRLEQLGYLEIVHQYREDGGQCGNAYCLNLTFRLPTDRYRIPPPCRPATPPRVAQQHPPVSPAVTPLNVPSERPMITKPISADAQDGFAFLETEPLYRAAVTFLVPPQTRVERGKWARAIAAIRDACGTVYQLHKATRNFRTMYPRAHVTIMALANNWAALLQGDQPYGANRPDSEAAESERAAEAERLRLAYDEALERVLAEP